MPSELVPIQSPSSSQLAIETASTQQRQTRTGRHGTWLQLPEVPLDRNGPVSLPYTPTEANWTELPFVERFRSVVDRFTDHTAVDDGLRQLTYRQVWNGACRLAQRIAAATPEGAAVGILLPSQGLYPVAVLACLAAGRPCAVLDLHYPADRNRAIIEAARLAAIIVSGSEADDQPPAPPGVARIAIDDTAATLGPLIAAPGLPADLDAPAVIVYTSGSTGAPKGLVLSQRAILARQRQLIDGAHLNERDVSMPLRSPATVGGMIFMLEILLVGGRLIMFDLLRTGLGAALEIISAQLVSALFPTPAVLRALIRLDGARRALTSVRYLLTSGEALLPADLEALRYVLPQDCGIVIVYGATEAPAICQWFVPRDLPADRAGAVPAGYLLPGYACSVRDEADQPLGFDEIGELVIAGGAVALGEWQDGRLTPGPFTREDDAPGMPVLHTGDLVRVQRDGVFSVLGRKDRQVKIRGMRVEPAEIENALRRAGPVKDAAVIVRRDGEEAALLAFVVLAAEAPPDAVVGLRAQLRSALPAYMLPARITAVPALPVLPGQKVDTAALLALDAGVAEARTGPGRPATADAPSLVARAWDAVLGPGPRMPDRPFDEAGGDSLRLLQLVFELERLCGASSPLSRFATGMRAAEMAQVLAGSLAAASAAAAGEGSPLVLMQPGTRTPPVFIAHGLGGHLGELVELGRHISCQRPLYGLQLPGLDGAPPLDRIEYMAQHFLDAVRNIQPRGPYTLIGYCHGGLIMLEMAQRLLESGERVALLALITTYPNRSLWPLTCWLEYLGRRSMHHARVLARLGAGEMLPFAGRLLRSLGGHLAARAGSSFGPPQIRPDPAVPPGLQRLREGMDEATRRYRPRFYRGRITFVQNAEIGALPGNPKVWRDMAQELDIRGVPGDHIAILTVCAAELGLLLSGCIADAERGGEAQCRI